MATPTFNITKTRHPDYLHNLTDWATWRYVWEGGEYFTRQYLTKWSERESLTDFNRRLAITPVPGFAKAALVDIKNSVFHRMGDITRKGGSESYQRSIAGQAGGVDRRGASMNHFIGTKVLPEMLSMGRVGVFVDNIAPQGPTLADVEGATPYLYTYPVEDIMSWQCSRPEDTSDFQAVLLRDWCIDYDISFGGVRLPKGNFERYRLVWKGEDGFVQYQFFDSNGDKIHPDGTPGGEPVKLNLKRIPFVMYDIGDSLLKDIAKHQIALLNLASSDISYALKANFPFYVEQTDARGNGSHLKNDIMEDGTASTGGQAAGNQQAVVGAMDGRTYPIGANEPNFIHPSSEPLEASMKLQEKLENDIRKLVNLAIISLGNSRTSGEAKQIDNQGLEAGLAFIGLVLEGGERKIADHWSAYEGDDTTDTVIIKYPEQYSRKTQGQRIDEANELTKLMYSIPGRTIKKELAKDAAATLIGDRLSTEKLVKINREIDSAEYSTSDPKVIELAKEQGLASDVVLSDALGFDGETQIPLAREEHAKRIALIQAAQEKDNAAARGNPDLAVDPNSGRREKQLAKDTTLKTSTKKPVRGEGRSNGDT